MNRTQVIIIALAAFIGLWMFSQSGKASIANGEGAHSKQLLSDSSTMESV